MDEVLDEFRGSTGKWLIGSFAGWVTILLLPLGIGFAIIVFKWLDNMSSKYEVTADRLIVKNGIVFKSIDEVELYRVKDVRVDFSLLNQMADIGTITLDTSDRTTAGGTIELADIPAARRRREELRHLVEQARQRRRVREVDFGADGF